MYYMRHSLNYESPSHQWGGLGHAHAAHDATFGWLRASWVDVITTHPLALALDWID